MLCGKNLCKSTGTSGGMHGRCVTQKLFNVSLTVYQKKAARVTGFSSLCARYYRVILDLLNHPPKP